MHWHNGRESSALLGITIVVTPQIVLNGLLRALSSYLPRRTLYIPHALLIPSSLHQRFLHLREAEASAQEPQAGGEQENVQFIDGPWGTGMCPNSLMCNGEQEHVTAHWWAMGTGNCPNPLVGGKPARHKNCRIDGNRSLHTNVCTSYKLKDKIAGSCISSKNSYWDLLKMRLSLKVTGL